MKKVLFFSVALVATGLQGSENEPKVSPIKVLVRNGVSVQPVPLTVEPCNNSSFSNVDMKTPSKVGTSPVESTPSYRTTTPYSEAGHFSEQAKTPDWYVKTMETIYKSQGRRTPLSFAIPGMIAQEIESRAACLAKEQRSMAEIARLFAKGEHKLIDIQNEYEERQTLLKDQSEYDDLGGWERTCAAIVNAKK